MNRGSFRAYWFTCAICPCVYSYYHNALQHIRACAMQSVEGSLLFSEGMIQKRERNNIYSGYKLV